MASAIDIMIHLGRLRDKSRKVISIMEVGEYKNGNIELTPLFEFKEKPGNTDKVIGELKKQGELKKKEKLISAGERL